MIHYQVLARRTRQNPRRRRNPIIETEEITYKIEEYEDKRIIKVKACKNNHNQNKEEKNK